MAKREDGKETRWRLLNAACEVFAQKGYRDAKVADICKTADANVAAVNYYFGDKVSLYEEAWRHALQNFAEHALNRLPVRRKTGYGYIFKRLCSILPQRVSWASSVASI